MLIPKGRRRPRASFERTIGRIVNKIESAPIHEVRWKGDYFERFERRMARVKVKSLWIVGSFARGAPTCGDLDLVMDTKLIDGHEPRPRTIASQVAGSYPDVVFYIGTPEKNTAGIKFPEAVLLWSQECPDWKSALGNIQVDENATRFIRHCDALPLRKEQFDYQNPDELLDLRKRKIISWEWVPIEAIGDLPDDDQNIQLFRRLLSLSRGKKTLETLQFAVTWFSKKTLPWSWDHYGHSDSRIRMGCFEILSGIRPPLTMDRLNSIGCSSIALIPHISRRGPNGIWIISRGNEHPLEKTFASLQCNVLADCTGNPIIYDRNGSGDDFGIHFSHRPKHGKAMTITFSGRDLLMLLSNLQWFAIEKKDIRISRWWLVEEQEKAAIAMIQNIQ